MINGKELRVLRLVELSLEMEAQFKRFLEELEQQGQAARWLFEYKDEPFDMYVEKLQDQKQGKQLPDGWVSCSTLFLAREDGKILGKSSLRHELNDFLKNIGGHIGYVIRPDERQKGYGSAILKLTLGKAKELGLERVLVTCDEDNIASAKIIERSGGVLEDTYQEDETAVLKRRYWIEL
jgi:predicted acetyltransferase